MRLTDFAMLFLRFAASEKVAAWVFWCVLTSVCGIVYAAVAYERKKGYIHSEFHKEYA